MSPVPTGRNGNSPWQNLLKNKTNKQTNKNTLEILWDPRIMEMVLRISLVNSAYGDLVVEYLICCICLSQWNLHFSILLL